MRIYDHETLVTDPSKQPSKWMAFEMQMAAVRADGGPCEVGDSPHVSVMQFVEMSSRLFASV